jgi:hypothetical protein
MKKTNRKQLVLKQETLRNLSQAHLESVVGAAMASQDAGVCTDTCTCKPTKRTEVIR